MLRPIDLLLQAVDAHAVLDVGGFLAAVVIGAVGYGRLSGGMKAFMRTQSESSRALSETVVKLDQRVAAHNENRELHVSAVTIQGLFAKLDELQRGQTSTSVDVASLRADVRNMSANCRFCPPSEEEGRE